MDNSHDADARTVMEVPPRANGDQVDEWLDENGSNKTDEIESDILGHVNRLRGDERSRLTGIRS